MTNNIKNHALIFLTIVFAVASQFLMRWQARSMSAFPDNYKDSIDYFLSLMLNPWLIIAFLCTGLSGLFWFLAMTKFELSYAYPFVSLNFIFILGLSPLILQETVSINKLIGTLIIVVGVLVISRG